jgi:phospholipid/cholesterol/gamma-HCH transport system ATP-binding protein
MSEAFIEVRDLKKHFGANKVLDGIDLDLSRGLVTTIVGKSGMGKSVFLKCLAGIVEADGGEIRYAGKPFTLSGSLPNNRLRFSYMFQNNALFDSLNAFENVALPLLESGEHSSGEVRDKVEDLLGQLDLADSLERYPGELSGGMQKRVAFARALVTDPELVLFDEPTTGLDPERKFGIFDLIAEYREKYGFTALLVSHDIPEVFQISDRVAWLDGGRIRFFGTAEELESGRQPEVIEFLNKSRYSPHRKVQTFGGKS